MFIVIGEDEHDAFVGFKKTVHVLYYFDLFMIECYFLNCLQVCRDLLVLQQCALRLAQLCQLSTESVGQLRSSIVQDTVLVTRAYHALLCLTRAPAVQPTQQQLHAIKRVQAALGLQENNTALNSASSAVTLTQSTALFAVLKQGYNADK